MARLERASPAIRCDGWALVSRAARDVVRVCRSLRVSSIGDDTGASGLDQFALPSLRGWRPTAYDKTARLRAESGGSGDTTSGVGALAVVGLRVLAVALLTATLGHGVLQWVGLLAPVSHGRGVRSHTPSRGSMDTAAVLRVRRSPRIAGAWRRTSGVKMAEDVRAEIVASVLEVVVSEGDQIGEGDTVVLLESMKMEIPVLAEPAAPSPRSRWPSATSSRPATSSPSSASAPAP